MYYRVIFERSSDAIFLTSPDGLLFKANTAARDMFRRNGLEISQLGLESIFDKSDPRLTPALKERTDSGQIRTELSFVRSDGSKFVGDFISADIVDDDGRRWTVSIVRDILCRYAADAQRFLTEQTPREEKYDFLTGVLNKNGFMDKVSTEINRSLREHTHLSILLLDIDDFREINGRYGSKTGDIALRKLALLLQVSVRSYDTVGRFGGDEFAVCLPNTAKESALRVAEHLADKAAAMKIESVDDFPAIKVSSGSATFSGEPGETAESLIFRLNQSLYQSKAHREKTACAM